MGNANSVSAAAQTCLNSLLWQFWTHRLWRCPQDVQLALQLLPLPGQLGALSRVGEALGMMQPLRVGLASLIFSGRLRIALKPLMNKLPIVAAMQARRAWLLMRSLVGRDNGKQKPWNGRHVISWSWVCT